MPYLNKLSFYQDVTVEYSYLEPLTGIKPSQFERVKMDSSARVSSLSNTNTSHHIQQHSQSIPPNEIRPNPNILGGGNSNKSVDISGCVEAYHSSHSPHSPHSPSHYSNGIASPSSSISINNDTYNSLNNSTSASNGSIQFKNYTVRNPPGTQQLAEAIDNDRHKHLDAQSSHHVSVQRNNTHYPTPNNTPIPPNTNTNNNVNYVSQAKNNINSGQGTKPTNTHTNVSTTNDTSNRRRNSTLVGKETKVHIANDKFPANIARDANGYPILSRDFVVRRISEGETGRLKEELKCEACGKGYKHITSLAKHLWEHTAEWQTTKKLLISKHQQAQLLEAASILCSLGEKSLAGSSPSSLSPSNTPTPPNAVTSITSTPEIKYETNTNSTNHNKLYQLNHHNIPMARRKSKSESTKTGKFGGKRRSKSFAMSSTSLPVNMAMSNGNSNGAISNSHKHHQRVLSGADHSVSDLESATAIGPSTTNANNSQIQGLRYGSSMGVLSSVRRDSESAHPPVDLRRPSMHMSPSISISASRRGSLLGSLIKEETNDAENSLVIYDSEDED